MNAEGVPAPRHAVQRDTGLGFKLTSVARHSLPTLVFVACIFLWWAAGAIFGAPPYVIAFLRTGNPVFPFLNTRFPSPLLERGIEFRNNQFTQPLEWRTPFELTFHTSKYIEGLDGALGFQYLLLIPLAVIALFAVRSYGARIASAIGLIAGAAVRTERLNRMSLSPPLGLGYR